jgi:8-oxo-dGTP pyrophosphatase MutT (NUDIX family)
VQGDSGKREIMLLTSRETRRWVIPKGWPMMGKKPAQAAAQEAYEDAGLIGEIVRKRPMPQHVPKVPHFNTDDDFIPAFVGFPLA